MKQKNKHNFKNGFFPDNINEKIKKNNTIEYFEKMNIKCESDIIKNPSEKFSLYKSNPIKQFMFSLYNELNNLEELFISNFIKENKRKKENEIRELFPKKKKEYEDRIKILLDKANKELITNHEVIDRLKKKNLELKNQLQMLENHNVVMNNELKESDISIKKLNDKYEIYTKLKKTYDEFCSGINYREKENIENNISDFEKEFKINKNLLKEVEDELKQRKNQISELKQKINEEENRNSINNYKLYNEFFDIEKNNKIIETENKNKLYNIKQDINSNNSYTQEMDKIYKSFISIFNLFYPELNLERNLIKNPKNINLIKSDYTPQTFVIEEVVNYIILMIENSTDESCFELLKNIASYINMILREIGGGLNNMKFDPVLAINEIEKNMNLTQKENETLTENIKELENKIILENKSIQKLNEQIKNIKLSFEKLKEILNDIYIKNKKDRLMRKCLSANSFKIAENKNNILKNENRLKFNDIKKNFEKEQEKVPLNNDNLEKLINRINRLYFHRLKNKKYAKGEINRNAYIIRRMDKKLKKLKNMRKYHTNFLNIESVITSKINRNIDNLILNFQKNYN